jgi:hypothetical protein
MTQLIIRKATRKKAKLRLGISAPSGGGKTMSALLLAYGMMREAYPSISQDAIWDKIGVMDTEEGSAELYVGVEKYGVKIGEFPYIRISNNYDPVNYTNAIHAFEKSGVEVIIADSLSHAWAGKGGLLDKQNKIAEADPKKNSYTAWRTITPQHDALVAAMLQSPCHIIGTMRSKVEYAMQQGINGKQQVVKMGMAPIQREGMEYEFTVFLDIQSDNHVAHSTKDRTDLFSSLNADGTTSLREFIITPDIGGELMRWLETGAEAPRPLMDLVNEMAADVQNSTNVAETVKKHQATFDRLQAEDAFLFGEMNKLLEARHAELTTNQTTEQ